MFNSRHEQTTNLQITQMLFHGAKISEFHFKSILAAFLYVLTAYALRSVQLAVKLRQTEIFLNMKTKFFSCFSCDCALALDSILRPKKSKLQSTLLDWLDGRLLSFCHSLK